MKAFPWSIDNGETIKGEKGMDLRDYFAAKAMQALIWNQDVDLDSKEDVAVVAYEYADVMMEARKE